MSVTVSLFCLMAAMDEGTTRDDRPPVVVIEDAVDGQASRGDGRHARKRARRRPRVLDPDSPSLLDDMLFPLPAGTFLGGHFRTDAVHVSRRGLGAAGAAELVSGIVGRLYGLDRREVFAETASEAVFLWLAGPGGALDSVEVADPDACAALQAAGGHAAYCRAPPPLERSLVSSLLRATGMGGGHYHPPHGEAVTLGGPSRTLGRGEVELFVGPPGGRTGAGPAPRHVTGWHTDFQENFTVQLSGVKRWTLRRGRVPSPLRATTPHYAREAGVVENQLKVARMSCGGGGGAGAGAGGYDGPHGFECGEDNAHGPEQAVTLHPGDVLYFPSGMWHTVETVEEGVSLNVSLMGTTYAEVACEAIRHIMYARGDGGWREVVTSNGPGGSAADRLAGLMGGLAGLVDGFLRDGGGAASVLPPALCHAPMERHYSAEDDEDDGDRMVEERGGSADECAGGDSDGVSDGEGGEEDAGGSDGEAGPSADDPPVSGIVVDIDDFEGPPTWLSWRKPPGGRLVRNPLASLIPMEDISRPLLRRAPAPVPSALETAPSPPPRSSAEMYVLNVNYGGNEMYDSNLRVILETSDERTRAFVGECIELDTAGSKDDWLQLEARTESIPACLFYYGYFSWTSTSA